MSPSASRWASSSTVGSRLRYQLCWATLSYDAPKASTGSVVQVSSGIRSQPAGQENAVVVRPLGSIAVETSRCKLDQRLDVLRPVAAPPAVGGDAEVVDEPLGGDDARLGAGDAVGGVNETEVQARLRTQGRAGPASRRTPTSTRPPCTGQMDPVQRPAEAERQGIGDVDERLGVVGPFAVVTLVAVAEVVAELDVGRDAAAEPDESLDDARSRVVEPRRHDAVEHGELEVGVPLHGELVVGDRLEDRRQLVEDARLVQRLDAALVLGGDERGDRGQRRRQRHLEPAVRRDLPVALAAGEDLERRQRGLGVAEVVEAQRVERLAVADPQPWERPMLVGARWTHLELRAAN